MRLMRSIYIFTSCLLFFQNSLIAEINPDTLNVLALRVEFERDNATTTTGDGKFDLSTTENLFQVDPPPHNRSYFQDHLKFLQNYYLKASNNQLVIQGNVFPVQSDEAYQLPKQMTAYNPNTTPDANNIGLANLFRDALHAADLDPQIEFSSYQSIVIFHAGVGKDVELGVDETPQDIPSLFITSEFLAKYLGQSSIVVDQSIEIKNGMILPETESQGGIELGLNGILVSNFGSQLGWPDLFSPDTRRPGIGIFGLMDVGLFNGDGLLPAFPSAWTRIYAGWEVPIDVNYASDDAFTIHHTASDHPDKIFRIPLNVDEYFLIENRYAGKKSLDSIRAVMFAEGNNYPTIKEVLLTHFPDEVRFSDSSGVLIDVKNPDLGLSGSGVLIWHIDEKIIKNRAEENRINADPEHRGIDLEEADGSQDIGQDFDFLSAGSGSENGWRLDMWTKGNTAPLFKNRFDVSSVPNSRSNYNRANSHISIFDFSAADSVMTFKISFNIFQKNFPGKFNPEIFGNILSLKTADFTFDGKKELLLLSDKGKILLIDDSGNSVWGTETLPIMDLNTKVVGPPVIFNYPTESVLPSKGLVVLAENGMVQGNKIEKNGTVAPFIHFECETAITTYPMARISPDPTVHIFWGCENGKVFTMDITTSDVTVHEFFDFGTEIQYLHLNKNGQLITIDKNGNVYLNQTLIAEKYSISQGPVGDFSSVITDDGRFCSLDNGLEGTVYNGDYRYDSPMISFPVAFNNRQDPLYILAGNNSLYTFNFNFTFFENFPIRVIHSDTDIHFFHTPLISNFLNEGLNDCFGIIISDPAGGIGGFDLEGKQLANFPLTAGDSLAVPPVILDIDGDSDTEITAITKTGFIYVWDLPARYEATGWNQIYYDELNSNRVLNGNAISGENIRENLSLDQLLPENKVYNWPNPNSGNFTFIRFFLTETAQVSIKIFDIAGDLIDEFPGTTHPNADNEIRWNLTDIESGVYIAQVQAENANRREIRTIKIAVIK